MTPHRWAFAIAVVLAVMIGFGGYACDAMSLTPQAPSAAPEQPRTAAVPALDGARDQMLTLVDDVRRAIDDVAPDVGPWRWTGDWVVAACLPTAVDDANSLALPTLRSTRALPDDRWDTLVPAVSAVAAPMGVTQVVAERNLPDAKDIRLSSDDGRLLGVGTEGDILAVTASVTCGRDVDDAYSPGEVLPLPPDPQ